MTIRDEAARAIDLVRVSKRFGDVVAVDDVSLSIGEGEFFSLLGPSGSGKTTVLRMIAGFEHPSEGAILLDGKAVGVTSSAGYGHTIGSHIAYGYVPAEAARETDYEVEAFCHRLGATRFDRAPYDPDRKKILA